MFPTTSERFLIASHYIDLSDNNDNHREYDNHCCFKGNISFANVRRFIPTTIKHFNYSIENKNIIAKDEHRITNEVIEIKFSITIDFH